MAITYKFHGHATHELNVNGTVILIDPFFSGNPAATISAEDVNPDYILVSHGHGDHVGDTVALAKRTGAKVIANFEIAEGWLMQKQGVDNVHPQHIGGGFNHPFGYVKMTNALHGSQLPDGTEGGNPVGFLLEIEGKRLYFACDTGLFSDMALIGEGGLDLAVLPIGDNFTMGPADAKIAVERFLKPKIVVPVHYNTWPPIAQDAEAFKVAVESATDSKVVVMTAGDSISI